MSMEDEGMDDEHGRWVSYWPLHGLTSAEPMSFGDDHCLWGFRSNISCWPSIRLLTTVSHQAFTRNVWADFILRVADVSCIRTTSKGHFQVPLLYSLPRQVTVDVIGWVLRLSPCGIVLERTINLEKEEWRARWEMGYSFGWNLVSSGTKLEDEPKRRGIIFSERLSSEKNYWNIEVFSFQ